MREFPPSRLSSRKTPTLRRDQWHLLGSDRIDRLWSTSDAPPIARGDSDVEAVGAIQDLLIGQSGKLPGILDAGRGQFGALTQGALGAFQGAADHEPTGQVDHDTLHLLAERPAITPITSRVYLTLVLDLPWTGFTRLVALSAQFEGAGKFGASNRNRDHAGLSFGIIQWAQKPGRLNELLRAFERADGDKFVAIFGAGDPALAAGLLEHTQKALGGVDGAGRTIDPRFDLVNDVWSARFHAAAIDRLWQKTQIHEAVTAFRASCATIRAISPIIRSERAFAFLLDTANQHGDGGLRNICKKVLTGDMTESAFLAAVQAESVRRLEKQFGVGSDEAVSTHRRREAFRTSPLLSDELFQEA